MLHLLLIPLLFLFFPKKEKTSSKDFESDIYSVMHKYQNKEDFAGMGLLYYSDKLGEQIITIGKASVGKDIPLDSNSAYDIGSTTKMFISILIMQLEDEGELRMDSSVSNWVDIIPNGNKITIAHLLNHTSGLNDYLNNSNFIDQYYSENDKKYSTNDIIRAGIADTSNTYIGTWKYSNTNYLILGKIVEQITGNTLGKELQKRIFNPAGMKSTYYMPECKTDQVTNLAIGYQFGNPMTSDNNYFLYNAAGGIVSTLGDMKCFAQWLLNNNYPDKLADTSVDCLIENELNTKYGKGIIISDNAYYTSVVGHGGTSFGFKSEFWISPETKEIIIYFVNDYMYKKNYAKFRDNLDAVIQTYN